MRTPPPHTHTNQNRVGRPGGEIHHQAHWLIISKAKQRFSHQSRCDGCRGCHVAGGGIHTTEEGLSPELVQQGLCLTQIQPQDFSLVSAILGCFLARGSEMSRVRMLNDMHIQNIHPGLSGEEPQPSWCDRWAAVRGQMTDTDTCRVQLTRSAAFFSPARFTLSVKATVNLVWAVMCFLFQHCYDLLS